MFLISYILALAALAIIAVQDFKFRAIHWVTLPVLFCMLVLKTNFQIEKNIIIESTLLNFSFVFFQILILMIYFTVRKRHFEKVINTYLGLGDVLFLLAIAPALGFGNYLLFLVTSLLLTLLFFPLYTYFRKVKSPEIPLAGIQAILFSFWLITEWAFNLNISHTYLPVYFAN